MATRKQQSTQIGDQTNESDSVYYSRFYNEDALINQRLTWLLLAQGLLFAAYGTVATKAVDSCDEKAEYLFSVLGLISKVGPIFAAVIFTGIAAAIAAQGVLHYKRKPGWRGIGVSTATTLIGWMTGLSVPIIFFVAWCYIPTPDVQKVVEACKAANASRPSGTANVPPASIGSAVTLTSPAPKGAKP